MITGSLAVLITVSWFIYAISTDPIEPETPEIIHQVPTKREHSNPEPANPEPVRHVTTTTRTRTTYVKRFFTPRFPKFRK
jgi:hypothetical protein